MTTHDDIKEWFKRGLKDKSHPTHFLVVCDTFDHDDYPVFVKPDEDVHEIASKYNGTNMQVLMEVYHLGMDMETQLAEHRSFNYDIPATKDTKKPTVKTKKTTKPS